MKRLPLVLLTSFLFVLAGCYTNPVTGRQSLVLVQPSEELALGAQSFQKIRADEKVSTAIRAMAAKMPTYITVKDVKKRWGHGQEDVFPVTQFEKLWVDMTALPEIDSRFVVVPRLRGQQLKDQAQLDGWLRDGSAAYVESLCEWS